MFEPLVSSAMRRTLRLIEAGSLSREDGLYLLRALIDIEADGVELFDPSAPADAAFYREVATYVAARAGEDTAQALVFDQHAASRPLDPGIRSEVDHFVANGR
jgi:hypothetical protein